jgi:hypothetical protein
MDLTVATGGQAAVVSDQQQCCTGTLAQVEQQVDDSLAGCMVEVAGGLVCQQQGGFGGEGACQGGTLLFAARKLTRKVRQSVAEADRGERGSGAVVGVADAGKLQGNGNVFQRRHCRDQVEGLEDNANLLATQSCQGVLV